MEKRDFRIAEPTREKIKIFKEGVRKKRNFKIRKFKKKSSNYN